MEAEEAEDPQEVFLDARLGAADEAHPPLHKIVEATERVENCAVSVGIERVEGEIAPARVFFEGAREGDLGMPPVGLDVLPKRRHLEGNALRDQCDGSVLQPCGNSL